MNKNVKDAIKNRRSHYSISNESLITDDALKDIIHFAVMNVPSSFNSQSARLVLLLNGHHTKFWDIVKECLRPRSRDFNATEEKINSFAAGYGTVLFYEDRNVIESLQEKFPSYRDNFPVWSHQASAMHQFAVWIMLEDAGFGASLQHYNPIIDQEVAKEWGIDPQWQMVAQMPFGVPTSNPAPKQFQPLDGRVKIFE